MLTVNSFDAALCRPDRRQLSKQYVVQNCRLHFHLLPVRSKRLRSRGWGLARPSDLRCLKIRQKCPELLKLNGVRG